LSPANKLIYSQILATMIKRRHGFHIRYRKQQAELVYLILRDLGELFSIYKSKLSTSSLDKFQRAKLLLLKYIKKTSLSTIRDFRNQLSREIVALKGGDTEVVQWESIKSRVHFITKSINNQIKTCLKDYQTIFLQKFIAKKVRR